MTGGDEIAPVTGTENATAVAVTSETLPASTTRDTAPKPNKRASIFGGFFGKKDAAATPSATETAPAIPMKDEPSTVSSAAPQLENPMTEPATAATAGTTATETPAAITESTTPGAITTPTDKRRSSFFSNLGAKKERRTGTTSGDELTDGEGNKQPSGGFGGLLRKASRAQKGSSRTRDAADVPLPKESSTTAAPFEGTAGAKPGLTEGEAGSSTVGETHEQTPVSAAA